MPLKALPIGLSRNARGVCGDHPNTRIGRTPAPYSRRIIRALPVLAALLGAACAADGGPGGDARNLGELGLQRLVLPAAPPLIDAQDAKDVDRAMRLAERYDRPKLEQQRRTRLIEAVQTPLLYERGARRLRRPRTPPLRLTASPDRATNPTVRVGRTRASARTGRGRPTCVRIQHRLLPMREHAMKPHRPIAILVVFALLAGLCHALLWAPWDDPHQPGTRDYSLVDDTAVETPSRLRVGGAARRGVRRVGRRRGADRPVGRSASIARDRGPRRDAGRRADGREPDRLRARRAAPYRRPGAERPHRARPELAPSRGPRPDSGRDRRHVPAVARSRAGRRDRPPARYRRRLPVPAGTADRRERRRRPDRARAGAGRRDPRRAAAAARHRRGARTRRRRRLRRSSLDRHAVARDADRGLPALRASRAAAGAALHGVGELRRLPEPHARRGGHRGARRVDRGPPAGRARRDGSRRGRRATPASRSPVWS